jgi:hypothetical protein
MDPASGAKPDRFRGRIPEREALPVYSQKHASGDGMKFVLHPWQILLLVLAGWIKRQQQNAIEYLIAENRILREKLGKKRILLGDWQ